MSETTEATTFEVDVPLLKGKPPLTANQRLHWREKANRTSGVRSVVAWRARQQKIPHFAHITVRLHYHAGDHRRRDAFNLADSVKPGVDGLVDAGVVSDDDDPHVTVISPYIHPPEHGKPRRLWLTITPTET